LSVIDAGIGIDTVTSTAVIILRLTERGVPGSGGAPDQHEETAIIRSDTPVVTVPSVDLRIRDRRGETSARAQRVGSLPNAWLSAHLSHEA
jgi:hypothetical protein